MKNPLDSIQTSAPDQSLRSDVLIKKSMIPKLLCQELHLRDMFGGHLNMTLVEFSKVITHPKTLFCVIAVVTSLMLTDPPGLRYLLSVPLILLHWFGGGFLVLFFKHISLVCMAAISMRRPQTTFYMPIFSVIEFSLTLWIAEQGIGWLQGVDLSGLLLGRYFQYMFLFLVIEALFTHFVIPTLDINRPPAESQEDQDDRHSTDTDRIMIAGRSIRIEMVNHIMSEEHYLTVTLRSETIVHRAKLSDIVGHLPAEAGLQPHRSWWVSRQMKPRIQKEGSRVFLQLEDGTNVPIARARVKAVQGWLDDYSDW